MLRAPCSILVTHRRSMYQGVPASNTAPNHPRNEANFTELGVLPLRYHVTCIHDPTASHFHHDDRPRYVNQGRIRVSSTATSYFCGPKISSRSTPPRHRRNAYMKPFVLLLSIYVNRLRIARHCLTHFSARPYKKYLDAGAQLEYGLFHSSSRRQHELPSPISLV